MKIRNKNEVIVSWLGYLILVTFVFAGVGRCAQNPSDVVSQTVEEKTQMRLLPGGLNNAEMFNSNSPEVVQKPGILLSTFAPDNMSYPEAHLNHPLKNDFAIFSHHIAKGLSEGDQRTLYQAIILYNAGAQKAKLKIYDWASYLSQPDAAFVGLSAYLPNDSGQIFSGPGDRVTTEILLGLAKPKVAEIVIEPGAYYLLANLPIPVKGLSPPLNGRSTLGHLHSSQPLSIASLAMFAPVNENGVEREPNIDEWTELLKQGDLAGPRDKVPSAPEAKGPIVYGRVAGVSLGTSWRADLVDASSKQNDYLTIADAGSSISYPLASVRNGTFGTGQVQSAPMLVRYPDTAYQAHGNYGIEYDIRLNLFNPYKQPRTIDVIIQTPLKNDMPSNSLFFLQPATKSVFFRGSLELKYKDDFGVSQKRYIHLVQYRGQKGQALVSINLAGHKKRTVDMRLIYPPDATPPQVLTIYTNNLEN